MPKKTEKSKLKQELNSKDGYLFIKKPSWYYKAKRSIMMGLLVASFQKKWKIACLNVLFSSR